MKRYIIIIFHRPSAPLPTKNLFLCSETNFTRYFPHSNIPWWNWHKKEKHTQLVEKQHSSRCSKPETTILTNISKFPIGFPDRFITSSKATQETKASEKNRNFFVVSTAFSLYRQKAPLTYSQTIKTFYLHYLESWIRWDTEWISIDSEAKWKEKDGRWWFDEKRFLHIRENVIYQLKWFNLILKRHFPDEVWKATSSGLKDGSHSWLRRGN